MQQLMTTGLSFKNIHKELLPRTEGWGYQQWIDSFEQEGIFIDVSTMDVLKKKLRPTRGVAYKVATVQINGASNQYQYMHTQNAELHHRLVAPPSIEAVCMFRKTHRYVDILTTFGASNIIAFYPSSSENVPQLQLIIGHAFNRDFLLATPLHQHSPLSPANRILYAG